ncbi:M20/M25/M40 family metallo-hydrolase [Polymorphobacter sp. PAMC 29334]|uniref:M20/M25/M40 family metallo-hydrolase n=1 Tax=Polymorphobacter sp. PAMC 29334 TaxID=2862331 RepID=UPI001C670D9F|nr:M20/M25/M40 family metallo-hydrolase [Polymorphobacter sp. PAMC 29334]QYE33896.1 M20/M25/M40 family metallo-hydrolase [Polymorphobacter sp. PAMC 29334]
MRSTVITGLVAAMLATSAMAVPPAHPQAETQALDLAKSAISLRSVRGPGNKTNEVAALYKKALVAGGFRDSDVEITPVDDTSYLIATWPGSDPKLKPLVISGHMDVVEAIPADWKRDPFTPVVENGYLYGRGASDMKLDGTIAIASLIELRREGYRPRRTIVIEFSGDEETVMKTSGIIAEKLSNADLVLNIDGGGGALDETTGKPLYWTWNGAEKTYADFELTVTNPGGHSSTPRPDNAIVQLSQALVRIGAYHFKPEVSDLTRAYFVEAAKYAAPATGAAMRAFAANPADPAAIATLTADPETVGSIGTTCVATMINGGHALNALPQRATANINCRIFPGHKPADIMAELSRVAAEPVVQFKDVSEGSVASAASPMRADFIGAVTRGLNTVYPGVPVFPSQASGASDSMWFRYHHVDSYGASPLFLKGSDDFAHGLNEREPVANIAPAITYYLSVFKDLSK